MSTKSIGPAVWIAALSTVAAALLTVVGTALVNTWNEEQMSAVEQAKLLAVILPLDPEERAAKKCELHHSRIFLSRDVKENLAPIAEDPLCTAHGYSTVSPAPDETPPAPDEPASSGLSQAEAVASCLEAAASVTASCQAYDKAGFHGRPGARCELRLDAGKGRFFAQDRVTVLSESYRQIAGDRAGDAMEALESGDLVRSFRGSIGCTNDRGTGRTCAAEATVRAISYPERECADEEVKSLLLAHQEARGTP